jgi:hypothetical protein
VNAGGEDGGGYSHQNDHNENWVPWDENKSNFCMTAFRASSGYKPPPSREMFISPFCTIF